MAIMKKKIVSKIESPVVNEEQDAPVELLKAAAAETVSVKIKRGGEYGSWGIELFHSKAVIEGKTAEDTLDEIIDMLHAKVNLYVENNSEPVAEPEEAASNDAEETPDPEASGEEDVLTEEDVLAMTKAELIILIAEQELDINPKEYKKQADLANAIVEVLFGEEGAAEGSEESAGEEGDELTPEMIREMERPELEQLIKDSEDLDINPKKFKKTSDLAEAIIEACFTEEAADGAEEGAADGAEGEEISPEMIREMERPELVDLIKSEELKIDPKKFKKTSDLAEAIITELFVDEEDSSAGGDWEDTDFGD